MKRSFSCLIICIFMFLTLTPVPGTFAQAEIWSEPVNLSRSGSAGSPVIFATAGGLRQAFWWDKFDGLMTSINEKGTWSEASFASIRTGTLDEMPRLELDSNGLVHAFWIDPARNKYLFHSRLELGTRSWDDPELLDSYVHSFDVSASSSESLSLVYLRSDPRLTEGTGVYLLYKSNTNYGWEETASVLASPYFRNAEDGNSYLRVLDLAGGKIFLAWQDLRSNQIYYTYSTNSGKSWFESQAVTSFENKTSLPSLTLLPNSDILWVGQNSGSGCGLAQAQLSLQAETPTWAAPNSILEDENSCPTGGKFFTDDGQLYWIWGEGTDRLFLSGLDLNSMQWSPPIPLSFDFTDPETENPFQLDELGAFLKDGRIIVAGSDGNGDVWVFESETDSFTFAQIEASPQLAWSEPLQIPLGGAIDGMPAITTDPDGNTHLAWSQSPSPDVNGTSIYYTRWISDANTLAYPVELYEAGEGEIAHQPDLVSSPDGWLHLTWSGGENSVIYYSRATLAEAASQGGWSIPEPITEPGIYSSPRLVTGYNGYVYILYTIPVNEGRGVYLLVSNNSGKDWSNPIPIFDAQANQWLRVDHPTLAISPDGSLYVAWTRLNALDRLSPGEIDISYSKDNGQTWSKPIAIAGQGFAWPRLVYNSGEIHILYVSTNGQVYHSYQLSKETSGSEVWSRPASVAGLQNLAFSGLTAPFSMVGDGWGEQGNLYLLGRSLDQGIAYTQWAGEQWQSVEYFQPDPASQPSSSVFAGVPPQGANLSVVWLSTVQEESISSPASSPVYSYALNLTQRKIPVLDIPAQLIQPTAVLESPTETPLSTPTVESTPLPTPTVVVAGTLAPAQPKFLPLILGGGLAAIALGVILFLRFFVNRVKTSPAPFRK